MPTFKALLTTTGFCLILIVGISAQSETNKSTIASTLELNLLSGASQNAHGATLSILKEIKTNLGIGPAISYIDYDGQYQESMLNLGIRTQYNFWHFNRSYMFGSIDGGIGIPYYQGQGEWIDSPFWGQAYVQPAIGMIIGTSDHVGVFVKVGYQYQEFETAFLPEKTNNQEWRYKRWNFAFGFSF